MMKPYPSKSLAIWPVSTRVNSPGNDTRTFAIRSIHDVYAVRATIFRETPYRLGHIVEPIRVDCRRPRAMHPMRSNSVCRDRCYASDLSYSDTLGRVPALKIIDALLLRART
jgi:hypothetical protein